jgi:hypothetical protein
MLLPLSAVPVGTVAREAQVSIPPGEVLPAEMWSGCLCPLTISFLVHTEEPEAQGSKRMPKVSWEVAGIQTTEPSALPPSRRSGSQRHPGLCSHLYNRDLYHKLPAPGTWLRNHRQARISSPCTVSPNRFVILLLPLSPVWTQEAG